MGNLTHFLAPSLERTPRGDRTGFGPSEAVVMGFPGSPSPIGPQRPRSEQSAEGSGSRVASQARQNRKRPPHLVLFQRDACLIPSSEQEECGWYRRSHIPGGTGGEPTGLCDLFHVPYIRYPRTGVAGGKGVGLAVRLSPGAKLSERTARAVLGTGCECIHPSDTMNPSIPSSLIHFGLRLGRCHSRLPTNSPPPGFRPAPRFRVPRVGAPLV